MYGTRELHHARALVTPSNNEQAAANHGNGALSAVPVNTMDRTGTPVTAACGSTSRWAQMGADEAVRLYPRWLRFYVGKAVRAHLRGEALRADERLHAQVQQEFLEEHPTAPCLESRVHHGARGPQSSNMVGNMSFTIGLSDEDSCGESCYESSDESYHDHQPSDEIDRLASERRQCDDGISELMNADWMKSGYKQDSTFQPLMQRQGIGTIDDDDDEDEEECEHLFDLPGQRLEKRALCAEHDRDDSDDSEESDSDDDE